jgi:hypothetical protein
MKENFPFLIVFTCVCECENLFENEVNLMIISEMYIMVFVIKTIIK